MQNSLYKAMLYFSQLCFLNIKDLKKISILNVHSKNKCTYDSLLMIVLEGEVGNMVLHMDTIPAGDSLTAPQLP